MKFALEDSQINHLNVLPKPIPKSFIGIPTLTVQLHMKDQPYRYLLMDSYIGVLEMEKNGSTYPKITACGSMNIIYAMMCIKMEHVISSNHLS